MSTNDFIESGGKETILRFQRSGLANQPKKDRAPSIESKYSPDIHEFLSEAYYRTQEIESNFFDSEDKDGKQPLYQFLIYDLINQVNLSGNVPIETILIVREKLPAQLQFFLDNNTLFLFGCLYDVIYAEIEELEAAEIDDIASIILSLHRIIDRCPPKHRPSFEELLLSAERLLAWKSVSYQVDNLSQGLLEIFEANVDDIADTLRDAGVREITILNLLDSDEVLYNLANAIGHHWFSDAELLFSSDLSKKDILDKILSFFNNLSQTNENSKQQIPNLLNYYASIIIDSLSTWLSEQTNNQNSSEDDNYLDQFSEIMFHAVKLRILHPTVFFWIERNMAKLMAPSDTDSENEEKITEAILAIRAKVINTATSIDELKTISSQFNLPNEHLVFDSDSDGTLIDSYIELNGKTHQLVREKILSLKNSDSQ